MTGSVEAVVFAIDGTLFALPVTAVREILDHRPAFRVPSAPDWLIGLIDVRGHSVAVIDLRAFGTSGTGKADASARILIVETDQGGECLGLLVDQVLDVARHGQAEAQDVPAIVPQHGPWRLSAILRRDEQFVGLLDLGAIAALAEEARHRREAIAA